MLAIFLDQETTGLDSERHRTIEIAFKIIDVATDELLESYGKIVRQPRALWDQHDPSSLVVNGFTWEKTETGVAPEVVSKEVKEILKKIPIVRGKAVFICQNPSFDRGFFNHFLPVAEQEAMNLPYHWLDLASMYWAARMFKARMTSVNFPKEILLSKDAIASYFGLPPETKPHQAMNGVDHLIQCYQALIAHL